MSQEEIINRKNRKIGELRAEIANLKNNPIIKTYNFIYSFLWKIMQALKK